MGENIWRKVPDEIYFPLEFFTLLYVKRKFQKSISGDLPRQGDATAADNDDDDDDDDDTTMGR